jgi:hypothetical protein
MGGTADIDTSGAVAIHYNKQRHKVSIYRPNYLSLKDFAATIGTDSIDIKPH